jgi:toluene monooxygenase system ferredoxin subunit
MSESPKFHRVCDEDDLWAGEMTSYEIDGVEILLVRTYGDEIKAWQGKCPHQLVSLVRGELEGDVLTCMAHNWSFNVASGKSVNPDDAELASYPVKVEDGVIYVSIDGIEPKFAHA